ncbi:MAG: class I SAM-dependent methyltransferase [Gemmatimonadetes bacterium]|jgi:SAM-dependent methyltransferase|nr:class I SAM-dependent methyltransferase [Gemmatimonadota bacterium]MBA4157690.1 class I SAM-dependent methyltransferase [Gemmatimonadota bacterium]
MINYLINCHDWVELVARFRTSRWRKEAAKLGRGAQARVEMQWDYSDDGSDLGWSLQCVQPRWNHLISGDVEVTYHTYLHRRYLAGRRDLTVVSIGCGAGDNERVWAGLGGFACIRGYDLSPAAIQRARDAATAEGLYDILRFEVADALDLDAGARYDVVPFEQALHHFSPLEKVLERTAQLLKPDGLLILNEYVGPTRFQWTDRQLEVINGLLAILPEHLRRQRDGRVKRREHRPGRLRMIAADPSEAAESGRILAALRERFEIVELRPYGGTVFHMLLRGIAHNFADTPEAQEWLELCFGVEDCALAAGELESDFVVAVCRAR